MPNPLSAVAHPGKRRLPAAAAFALGLWLLYALAQFVRLSLRWPLVGDATLLHYGVFLLRHGFAPYRQLIDINLPGTYCIEWLVTGLFGYGALAWRLFDLSLLLILGAASVVLLWQRREPWKTALGALWAAGLFALLHGRDGLTDLGQRDLLMTALLAVAYVFFFLALRLRTTRPGFTIAMLCGFGAALGAATTVKPLALLLLPVLLALFAWALRSGSRTRMFPIWAACEGWAACAGALVPLLAALLYLLHQHALGAFWQLETALVPLHSSLFRQSVPHLLMGIISSVMRPLFLLGLPVLLRSRPWRTAEGAALLAGFFFGALSFVVQGRGYPYHRYPSEFFLLLLYARAFLATLRPRPRLHWAYRACALGAVLFSAAALVPHTLQELRRFTPRVDPFAAALSSAIAQRGGPALADHVQCFDMAGGCVTTLLRLRLPQSTGFLYDCYAFAPVAPAFQREQQRYRRAWLAALQKSSPALLIVTSDECGPPDEHYTKLARWPALDRLLRAQYVLASQWTPTREENWNGHPTRPYGFRLYARRGSPR